MRKLLLFTVVCLLVAVDIQGQTTIQQGVTYRYNGKQQRTPLGNVTISYDANKRSTLSNEHDGSFTLLLDGGKMGDRIGLVTVKKREMMVFNQHAVDEWSIRKEPLVLILCNVDEFERQKNNLINIGKREAKKKYDRLKAELEAKLSASQMKQQEYEAALDQAYDELDRFQKNVGEYADLFARIDESEVDTLAQRALDLFNQGKADEAIRLFEQGHYMDKLDKALKNSQQADQLKAVAEQAKEQATQDSLKALQSLKAQIEAYKMNNEWKKAGELLKGLADRLNTVRACWNYAYFCDNQNNFKDSEVYYKRAISILDKQEDKESLDNVKNKASLLNNLATLYYCTHRFTEGEAMYKEALEICHRLAYSNPQTYESDVAQTQYNIGLLKIDMKQYKEAIPPLEETLSIYRRISQTNPAQTQGYEGSLYYLSQLYNVVKDYLAAYHLNQEWLPIMKKKYEADPKSLQSDYAIHLGGQSYYCIFAKQYAEAEQYAREGLAIDATKHYIYSNLAAALLFQGRYEEAEQIYRQYKDELKDSFLDDFKQYAEAGVIPEERKTDVERIKRLIEE